MASVNAILHQAVDGQVMQFTKKTKQYECLVCHKKLEGETPAVAHLQGKAHENSASKKAIENILKKKKNPPSLQKLLPSIIKVAANEDMISITPSKDYKCIRCDTICSGIKPLADHLNSSDHSKAKKGLQPIAPAPPLRSQPIRAPGVPDEIAREMRSRYIIETDNLTDRFHCTLCNKKFNSSGTLSDHLKSDHHKKKKMQVEHSILLPVPTSMGASPKIPVVPDEDKYRVSSSPRGHVYIFNYLFKGKPKPRTGAEQDSVNLINTFTKMGYKTFLFEDKTKDETFTKLREIQREPDLQRIDAFIMCILSHGTDVDTFYSSDNEAMSLLTTQRLFQDGNCPHLKGKPRIFLTNYCLGKERQRRDLDYDSMEAPKNIAIIYAATEGISAARSRSRGTVFIESFCEILGEHARYKDLRAMYLLLDQKMREKEGTSPMWKDYLFKTFYFNPVQ